MAEAPAAGARFGAYDILDELGSGGMGKVYRGRDRALERIVAIKILSSRFAEDESFIQRFLAEARSAARLNHPNIVHVYDLGICNGTYYIAMEYVDGESVGARLLRLGRMGEAEAVGLVRQACQALAAAHAEGIVHRDVKPDNMMLTRKGVLKLVDLGLAKRGEAPQDSRMTQDGYCVGTPDYIAPEQIHTVRDLDGRADIYSLGASLFHLVAGRTPFGRGPSPVILSRHLTEPLPDLRQLVPGLSEGLVRIVERMMAKDRAKRYHDCLHVDRDLAALAAGPDAVRTSRSLDVPQRSLPSSMASRATTIPSRPPAAWDAAVLGKVERELARSIGPLAKVLVKRAAAQATTPAELAARLSENLPTAPARADFEKFVKSLG